MEHETIIEGPNYFIRYSPCGRLWAILGFRFKYVGYIFEGNSPVAKKILKGRAKTVDMLVSKILDNA